jgi:glutathione S-transferase
MLLIGMFDSPYVRRVAVSMKRLGLPFEHGNWSVGVDFDRIRQYSPLGRVPVLVMDDGTVLVESGAILDTLDELAGPQRALMPVSGAPRREALRVISFAIGASEKARDQLYERMVRPPEKYHEPWVARCREQMHGALGQLERAARQRGAGSWLVDDRLTQADISVTCMCTLLDDALGVLTGDHPYPALAAMVDRCESLPEFRATREKWFAAEIEQASPPGR